MKNFEQDLIQLYCKTSNKKIEDILIRYSNMSKQDVVRWLKQQDYNTIGVTNQDTVLGINFLLRLRDKYPSTTSFQDIARYMTGNQVNLTGFVPAKAFSNLVTDARCSEILSPFSDILNAMAPMTLMDDNKNPISDSADTESLANDLGKVQKAYMVQSNINQDMTDVGEKIVSKKETKKEAGQRILTYLIHEFTNEFTSVMNDLGDPRAKEMEAFALPNPVKIMRSFSLKKDLAEITKDATLAVKIIMKNIKNWNPDEIYNYVKSRAYLHGKVISLEDYVNYHVDTIENKDMSAFTGEHKEAPENKKIEIPKNRAINSDAIIFVSFVLYGLFEKVR